MGVFRGTGAFLLRSSRFASKVVTIEEQGLLLPTFAFVLSYSKSNGGVVGCSEKLTKTKKESRITNIGPKPVLAPRSNGWGKPPDKELEPQNGRKMMEIYNFD